MKKTTFLSLIAITVLAGCNSKEKEEKAFARVSSSNNPTEMRAYLDQYFEDAPPGHLVKIRKNLRAWVEDSTAYANIQKAKDLETKISLENDYLSNFEDGIHKTEISDMLAKDTKALEGQKAKEEQLAKYNDFKENVVDYSFYMLDSPDIEFIGWIFGAPDDNGSGKGVFINNVTDIKERFTYKLADNGDLQIKTKNGATSINFMGDGLYRGDEYFKRRYDPDGYKFASKYFK